MLPPPPPPPGPDASDEAPRPTNNAWLPPTPPFAVSEIVAGIVLLFLMFFNILATRQIKIPYLNFLFLQNLILHKSTFYRETWTISVEEWFYISFPILFMLLSKVLKLSKNKIYLCVLFFM